MEAGSGHQGNLTSKWAFHSLLQGSLLTTGVQGEPQECALNIQPPEYPSEPDSRLVGVNDMSGVLCIFGPTIGVLCQFGPTGHF